MAENYMKYDRKEFEKQIAIIADGHGLNVGDFTNKQGRQAEELVYELTTQNPLIRILIYSSVDARNGLAREVGGDAVRVNLYCKHKGKYYYKKFKTHQRINTMFKNLNKSISAANDYSVGNEVEKWIYAVKKNT